MLALLGVGAERELRCNLLICSAKIKRKNMIEMTLAPDLMIDKIKWASNCA